MNNISRSYPVLLVIICLSVLLLLSAYAMALLPPVPPATSPTSPQISDLVLKLTPSAGPRHAPPNTPTSH